MLNISKKFSLLVGLFSVISLACAQPMEALKDELDRELMNYIASEKGPGISAAVSVDGVVVYSGQAGFRNLETGMEVSKDSVFRIGSITKQFTAAAILKLQDMKRLSVNDSVVDHLPGMPSRWRAIRLSNLLNHTSGIPSYSEHIADIDHADEQVAHKDIINSIRKKKLLFKPGKKWDYSNTNFYLLGMIIEKVSGKTYDAFLIDDLLVALDPHSISYCYTDRLVKNRAHGYVKDSSSDAAGAWKNSRFINMLTPFSAGALCGTSDDLVRWNSALSSGRIISPESYVEMTTNRKLNDGNFSKYGYGIGLDEDEDGARILHGGGIPGFSSSLVYYPESKIGIAVLINDEDEDPFKINKIFIKHVLNFMVEKRQIREKRG